MNRSREFRLRALFRIQERVKARAELLAVALDVSRRFPNLLPTTEAVIAEMFEDELTLLARVRSAHRGCGKPMLGCYDCGLPYRSIRFADFVVPDEIWKKISPTGDNGGILCVGCMFARMAVLGIECKGQFTSGPCAEWRLTDAANDPTVDAQHEETGRMWRGPLSQLPPRYAVATSGSP